MNASANGRLGTAARTIVAAGALAILGTLAASAPAAAQWGPGYRDGYDRPHHRWAPPPRRCWVERRRVWTQWGWRIERRRFCR